MIYYISDTHFGHSAIIHLCKRPFKDVDEMNKTLIANWNARVREEDEVYILGDMFYRCDTEGVKSILESLRGRKHLIVGNHDEWMDEIELETFFDTIDDMTELNDNDCICVLCHYPLLSWRKEGRTYMIYGHIHNDTYFDYWPFVSVNNRMLNAGVEINNYMPVTLNELITNNMNFKKDNADNLLTYRGMVGSIQVSAEDKLIYGKLLNVEDIVMYDGKSYEEFEKNFKETVDFYLNDLDDVEKDDPNNIL